MLDKYFNFRKKKINNFLQKDFCRDASPKGYLDKFIIPICMKINGFSDYFTTSSCSGRVTLLAKKYSIKKGGKWLLISHNFCNTIILEKVLEQFKNLPSIKRKKIQLTLRFEPFIVHLEARDLMLGVS